MRMECLESSIVRKSRNRKNVGGKESIMLKYLCYD